MTQEQRLLAETQAELETMYERLEELVDWCEDMGDYRAIQHKLAEAQGKLRSAVEACAQHRVGVLPQGKQSPNAELIEQAQALVRI